MIFFISNEKSYAVAEGCGVSIVPFVKRRSIDICTEDAVGVMGDPVKGVGKKWRQLRHNGNLLLILSEQEEFTFAFTLSEASNMVWLSIKRQLIQRICYFQD